MIDPQARIAILVAALEKISCQAVCVNMDGDGG